MPVWSGVSASLRRARGGAASGFLAAGLVPRRRRWDVDPFSALEVQMALSRLEAEITRLLRHDDDRFARGHHVIAARLAFDQVLEEACRMAGVTDLPESPVLRRVVAEVELRTRGWTW